jgi:methylmalonyl-CoA decarboxylase
MEQEIAMVHGSVWGGACDLIMSCDLVFGDETSAFAITPAKIGVPCNVAGLLNFLSRVPLTIAKEMFFTAGASSSAAS